MDKSHIIWSCVAGGIGIAFVYYAYHYLVKTVSLSELKAELNKALDTSIVTDSFGHIRKDQAAAIAGCILRFCREALRDDLAALRNDRISLLNHVRCETDNEYRYVTNVVKTIKLEHAKYNEVSHEACRYLRISDSILAASSEHYVATKDKEYAEMVAKATIGTKKCADISLSERQAILKAVKEYKESVIIANETIKENALYNAILKVAKEHGINVKGFDELVYKARVSDLLYLKYGLSEHEIEALQYM